MDKELEKRLDVVEEKVDAIYRSVEKTRRYFLTTLIVTIVMIFLPLIGLFFVIPSFFSAYSSMGGL